MDELETRVVQLVADTGKLELDSVELASSFDDLGLDSLDGANIVFAIEDHFDIYIEYEPQQLKGLTVQQAVDVVRALVAAKAEGIDTTPPG